MLADVIEPMAFMAAPFVNREQLLTSARATFLTAYLTSTEALFVASCAFVHGAYLLVTFL